MKIKITDIHPGDAKYYRKDKIIGKIGELAYVNNSLFGDMFMAGRVNDIDGDGYDYFAGFKYIEVPEPSAMSELAGWVDGGRDWKSIAIEKARELALMAKVADLWQMRLIEANERIEKLEGLLNDRPSASD